MLRAEVRGLTQICLISEVIERPEGTSYGFGCKLHVDDDYFVIIIIIIMYRMFETRADVMAMFEQFRSVDKADLGTSHQ